MLNRCEQSDLLLELHNKEPDEDGFVRYPIETLKKLIGCPVEICEGRGSYQSIVYISEMDKYVGTCSVIETVSSLRSDSSSGVLVLKGNKYVWSPKWLKPVSNDQLSLPFLSKESLVLSYVSDLHGSEERYKNFMELSNKEDVDIAVMGADMLPKYGGGWENQAKFINEKLRILIEGFNMPLVMCGFGNDDFSINESRFKSLIRYENKMHLVEPNNPVEVLGFTFIGLGGLVRDYPFALKDWCRRDLIDEDTLCRQNGMPLIRCAPGSYKSVTIEEWEGILASRNSLETELADLPVKDPKRTVMLTHQPPANLGLDVCHHGEEVGSKALTKWIEKHRICLGLYGHIHESAGVVKYGNGTHINSGDRHVYIIRLSKFEDGFEYDGHLVL